MGRSPQVGWLLTVEPMGDSIGWSLLRDEDGPQLAGVGLIDDTEELRSIANQLRPNPQAVANSAGRSGLWASSLSLLDAEFSAAQALGAALLPPELCDGLLARWGESPLDTVTIAARGWLASVPWEILVVKGTQTRLLEHCVVLGGLSPVISGNRGRSGPVSHVASPGYAVVDPGPLAGPSGPLYPSGYPERLTDAFAEAGDSYTPADVGETPDQLAFHLHQCPARLLYIGHIRPGPDSSPAGAAFVLRGQHPAIPDLLTARQWLATPERWPCPPRLALIGCASDDTHNVEQSGLVVAAIKAGAHLVTSTRWPLPVDHPSPRPRSLTHPVHHEGLTDLAVAVHRAHLSERPVDRLRRWQLAQLGLWQTTGDPQHSPLLWACLVTYAAAPPAERAKSTHGHP